jgi:hypothetical protein
LRHWTKRCKAFGKARRIIISNITAYCLIANPTPN